VSVVQFVVPLAITAGVFGWLGGAPQTATQAGVTTALWLQKRGFVFVPFIAASAFAAWFGMNDIATMKASFADQSVIFRRLHNWNHVLALHRHVRLVHRLLGGPSAAVENPLPGVNALAYAFLGRLVGALAGRSPVSRATDRWARSLSGSSLP